MNLRARAALAIRDLITKDVDWAAGPVFLSFGPDRLAPAYSALRWVLRHGPSDYRRKVACPQTAALTWCSRISAGISTENANRSI